MLQLQDINIKNPTPTSRDTDLDNKIPSPTSRYQYQNSDFTLPPKKTVSTLLPIRYKNKEVERESGETFNFALVNYYADCRDGIAYHSDDESFLGPNPTIASLSLGTTRDFLMKHKEDKSPILKLPLSNGEFIVMKGATQGRRLHSSMTPSIY
ncbi:uncharacterized protein DFL_007022 [Arthrobotrys flagrans]|uniref:Fe2OG dioxygenase domain-containing protein n=1 Tax=Arthrobotrys flagrans TaxID=97331 RepID=A0A436ZUK7_ARTFL|nr:hypothetical protein DFL_007022 [Arthrobotrys flagrans]